WVAEREPTVRFATAHLGMHVIDEQENFTLIGSDARRGKLTLFVAEGPRERGAIKHVALRVSDMRTARAALPAGAGAEVDAGAEIRIRLVEAPTDAEYDLDHVALFTRDPAAAAEEYTRLGFARAEPDDGNPR